MVALNARIGFRAWKEHVNIIGVSVTKGIVFPKPDTLVRTQYSKQLIRECLIADSFLSGNHILLNVLDCTGTLRPTTLSTPVSS